MPGILEEIKEWQRSEARETLKKCGLREGMSVLDFGCGGMHWTSPALDCVDFYGKVFALDASKFIFDQVSAFRDEQQLTNLIPVRLKDDKMHAFREVVDFILYFDIFHALGNSVDKALPAMERKKLANQLLMKEFHRVLSPGGLLAVAVYSEIGTVQDTVNGLFTPKGTPKWITVPYEKDLELYNAIPLICGCGFELTDTVKNAAIHFDEIELHLNDPKKAGLHLSDLERRDIWVFRKV